MSPLLDVQFCKPSEALLKAASSQAPKAVGVAVGAKWVRDHRRAQRWRQLGPAGGNSGTAEDASRAFDHAAHASLDAFGRQALRPVRLQLGARRTHAQWRWAVTDARLHARRRVLVLLELPLLGASLPYLAAAAQAHASV